MNAQPVDLRICKSRTNYLTGTLVLTVGVRMATGKTKQTSYRIKGGAGAFMLVKPDGEVYEVKKVPGRVWSCTCKDFLYRKREGFLGCKHVCALAKARLIEVGYVAVGQTQAG